MNRVHNTQLARHSKLLYLAGTNFERRQAGPTLCAILIKIIETYEKENTVEIIGNGNIVIQDVVGSKTEIDPNIKSDLQDLRIYFNNKIDELPSKIIELLETKLDIDINNVTKIEKQDLIISIDRLVMPKNKSDIIASDYNKESKILVEQLYKIFIKENYPVNKFMHFDNSATEIRY